MLYCSHIPALDDLTITPFCDPEHGTALLRFRFCGSPAGRDALRSWARSFAELEVIDTRGWSDDTLAAFRRDVAPFRCRGTAPDGSLDGVVAFFAIELLRWSRRALQLGEPRPRLPGSQPQRRRALPGLPPPHRFPRSSSSLPIPPRPDEPAALGAPLLQPNEIDVDIDVDDDVSIDIDIDIDTVPDQPGLVHWSLRS